MQAHQLRAEDASRASDEESGSGIARVGGACERERVCVCVRERVCVVCVVCVCVCVCVCVRTF